MNRIFRPSGENTGMLSYASLSVSWRTAPVSRSIT